MIDTGPGIPEKLLRKIFQPFFTTKGTAKQGRSQGHRPGPGDLQGNHRAPQGPDRSADRRSARGRRSRSACPPGRKSHRQRPARPQSRRSRPRSGISKHPDVQLTAQGQSPGAKGAATVRARSCRTADPLAHGRGSFHMTATPPTASHVKSRCLSSCRLLRSCVRVRLDVRVDAVRARPY